MPPLTAFVPILILVASPPATSVPESATTKALDHVKKACELVWTNAAAYEVQRCTERAMAALGEHERLRDSELKRLILESEKELESCQAQLDQLREASTYERSAAKRNPRH